MQTDATTNQFFPVFPVIEEFTIENNGVAARRVRHRLPARVTRIDDGEPGVP
jgi:hypothetical protein